ncbi:hypothetical protein PUN4_450150 [Paraburkholderia unamae]|uniref:hypothetical protein n=1 Tax=Paraburkholderia unamae TaxID=219649 RepID=UPI001CB254CF|nr:hypothetical protein [Paraburkholderia unamae]CAG9264261.1 hypothetical protein PUN4_450150 [Paraburkholderia unamae]
MEVSDIRLRGTGTALFWGFLSGDDHITGNVTVLDASGQPVDKLDVSAAYAADGIVGVAGEGRMTYLYNTFAKKALSALESPK